jgi:3-oxoadipate enol-lactonase
VEDEAQPMWQERIDVARRRGMSALAEPTMERWFTAGFRARQADQVLPIREQFVHTPVAGYTGCCAAIRRLDYLPRLHEVVLPTLVLVGAEDPATPVAAAEAIQGRIPGSVLQVMDDAAHLANIEQPRRFNDALLSFLECVG